MRIREILIVLLVIFACNMTYTSIMFALADINFAKALILVSACEKNKDFKYCRSSTIYFEKAMEYNNKEYLYQYRYALFLYSLFIASKKNNFINLAVSYAKKSEKYAWDAHQPHFLQCMIFKTLGEIDLAKEQCQKALYYLPHNQIILDFHNRIEHP